MFSQRQELSKRKLVFSLTNQCNPVQFYIWCVLALAISSHNWGIGLSQMKSVLWSYQHSTLPASSIGFAAIIVWSSHLGEWVKSTKVQNIPPLEDSLHSLSIVVVILTPQADLFSSFSIDKEHKLVDWPCQLGFWGGYMKLNLPHKSIAVIGKDLDNPC